MGHWLPTWLLIVMSLAYAGIAATHLVHATHQRGTALLWTSTHVLMAVGMLAMVLPTDRMVVSGTPVVLVFIAAGAVCAVVATRAVRSGNGADLWVMAVFDCGAMAYMFTAPSVQNLLVSLLLAVIMAVEAAYWASGHFVEIAERDGLTHGQADPGSESATALAPSTTRAVSVRARPGDTIIARAFTTTWLTHPTTLRVSMCLMALGMAYMLAAMALGTATMSGSGHMHGLSSP